ncbi:hypothetical protein GGR51DRAFT_539178 [Nemania sp. FL0031]|nr:hypothetical protein GGR51DRAFT_539178 [Nemania sp. FL0031]
MLCLLLITLTWLFIPRIASPVTATQQQCYYPRGNPSNTDIPCGDGVNHSHCCGFQSICLSNKLCLRTTGAFELSRASCTDSTWQSDNCPSHCTNVSISGGAPLALYSLPDSGPPQYCCGTVVLRGNGSSLGCYGNPYPFAIEPGDIIEDRGVLRGYNLTGSGESNSTCPPNSTCPKAVSSNAVVAVGAGLGVPLGILSIAAITWALWERYQRRNPQNQEEVERSKSEVIIPFRPQVLQQPTELRHDREPIELD